MINSRSIEDLTPVAQRRYHQFEALCNERGIFWMVTSTYRDQEQQDELFEQGRMKPGKVVTWTKHSRHTQRRAWDIVIIKPGVQPQLLWNVKADVDQDGVPDYEEAAQVGRHLGLITGADFKNPDWPHFEVPEGDK